MRRLACMLILSLLAQTGCGMPGVAVATRPIHREAKGTWTGRGQPFTLTYAATQAKQTGIFFTIEDGPPMTTVTDPFKGATEPMVGRSMILVRETGDLLPWRPEFGSHRISVSGYWNDRSDSRLGEGTATLGNGERAIGGILTVSTIKWASGFDH